MAEISGVVEIRADKRRGKMTIVVRSESGMEKEHHVPQDRHLLVHTEDTVDAGDPLIEGPLIPHDILRIKGEEALQHYLLTEVQGVYRSQNVGINDRHLEVVIAQMVRRVKIENPGDSDFLPGDTVDKFRFRKENERLAKSRVITNPGDTELVEGQIVLESDLEAFNEEAEEAGGERASGTKPQPATATTLLLGITKASLSSESFISSASFQETTKVLTEAALSGAVDRLRGLKENVILGHLIPAGSGFGRYQALRVKQLGEPVVPPTEEPSGPATGVLPARSLEGVGAAGGMLEPQRLPLPPGAMLDEPMAADVDVTTGGDTAVKEQ